MLLVSLCAKIKCNYELVCSGCLCVRLVSICVEMDEVCVNLSCIEVKSIAVVSMKL